jgi:hypothetical protein
VGLLRVVADLLHQDPQRLILWPEVTADLGALGTQRAR